MSKSIDNNYYTSENILSGDNILIYVGPADVNKLLEGGVGPLAEPGEDDTSTAHKLKLVGLLQGFNSSTARPQRQVPELGSKAKYLLSSRGQKQMALGRLMTDKGSVLHALYRSLLSEYPNIGRPKGTIWTSLDHPIFRKPIGMLIRIVRYDNDNPIDIDKTYFSDLTVTSIGSQINEGDRGIAENVSITWAKTDSL